MKLCITSAGKEMAAKTDDRFGRAPYFFIVDSETGVFEVIENSAAEQGQGAGIGAATLVMDRGVDGVLTGRVGPNAMKVFQASGVRLFENVSPNDTVEEALSRFRQGEYPETPTHQEVLSTRRADAGGRGQGGGGRGRGQGRGMGGGRGRR